ncbi:cobalamin-binding protein [Marinobacter pelagius]|uniref:cobalamin-binding protein n=1 Tax=Marinobacter sp. C7 TaxID=2951363 RepID=UPI001EF0E085|nr:cobalamin-binding protein [Marinobacter sp. C7]MCG7200553.1 cobalamin-binding protein [Marinobacter sp. C7]
MTTRAFRVWGTMAMVLALTASVSAADLCATDALERDVCLSEPARRVVSLSPGATELLFSAGAGNSVVAVSAWSDFPPQAAALPQVGDANRLDLEAIVSLAPDLVVAWTDGNSRAQLDRLADLGVPVFWLAPRTFGDIARSVESLGRLTGYTTIADREAQAFRSGIEALEARYRDVPGLRVFYQVWDQPLMTINAEELISKAIALCGGTNVFADLPRLVPRISVETVLAADPEVIVTAGRGDPGHDWLASWKAYPALAAVASGNLYRVSPSLLQRPTFRMLEGARELCAILERARARL